MGETNSPVGGTEQLHPPPTYSRWVCGGIIVVIILLLLDFAHFSHQPKERMVSAIFCSFLCVFILDQRRISEFSSFLKSYSAILIFVSFGIFLSRIDALFDPSVSFFDRSFYGPVVNDLIVLNAVFFIFGIGFFFARPFIEYIIFLLLDQLNRLYSFDKELGRKVIIALIPTLGILSQAESFWAQLTGK